MTGKKNPGNRKFVFSCRTKENAGPQEVSCVFCAPSGTSAACKRAARTERCVRQRRKQNALLFLANGKQPSNTSVATNQKLDNSSQAAYKH